MALSNHAHVPWDPLHRWQSLLDPTLVEKCKTLDGQSGCFQPRKDPQMGQFTWIHMEHLQTNKHNHQGLSWLMIQSWYKWHVQCLPKVGENGYLVIYHPAMTPSATIQAFGSSPATACRKPCSFRGAAPLAETARCKVGSASCARRWVKSCTAWKVEGHPYFWCEWKWIMISSQLRWHWHDRIMSCRSII